MRTDPGPSPPAHASGAGKAPAPTEPLGGSVGHYENFPVASWLCPAALRPAIAAIYHFARTADDIADEGDAPAQARLDELAAYRAALTRCLETTTAATDAGWPQVFGPLAQAARRHALPPEPLHDLISAFEQDVRRTGPAQPPYADMAELLAYCRLSANPVGRLLLHLYGVRDDEAALRQSDQICSALQLINFWQDLSVDLPRGRCYLPTDVLRRHGAQVADFLPGTADAEAAPGAARAQAVVAELCGFARALMLQGAPLVHRVPGRAGWELRLVVQGGLRILDAIAAQRHRSWRVRAKLDRADLPRLAWRALWM